MKYEITIILTFYVIQKSHQMKKAVDLSRLVIEEEGSSKIIDPSFRQDYLCSLGHSCIPLSECHVMNQLLKRSCLQTDKLRGLSCGYRGRELLVCCPQSCPAYPTPPTPGGTPGSPSSCGVPQISNWWATSSYFTLGSHPWVVRIGFKNTITNGIEYLCCGSIINQRTILTAAHCALAKAATHKIVSVRAGEFDSSQTTDCSSYGFCNQSPTDLKLNHVVVHPNYDSKTFANNIALLVLKEPLNYSMSVQPICIYPKERDYIFVNQRPSLVGWGKLSGQLSSSSRQQKLELPVQPLERCLLLYGTSVPIGETELCVGGEGRDACSGFGGAPLILLDPVTRSSYYQIGLLSFGSDRCGELGIPSVYTRVDKYTDWIHLNSPKE